METFRLLHVSDLHIGAVANQPPFHKKPGFKRFVKADYWGTHEGERPRDLSRLIHRLTHETPGLNGVVVTGDLAASGNAEDLAAAKKYLEKKNSGYPSESDFGLTQAGQVLLLMPGNHDRYSGKLGWSGGELFDETFKDWWRVGWGSQVWHRFEKSTERLTLLAADFCLAPGTRRPTKAWGTGRVCVRSLGFLQELTRALGNGDRKDAIVWCVHFPPDFHAKGRRAVPKKLRLDAGQTLLDAAEALQVKAILCGHLHKQYCPNVSEPKLLCAGSATAYEGERSVYSVLLHEVDVDGGVVAGIRHITYKWDHDLKSFA